MTLIQNCQVDWAIVLLIDLESQGFTIPFKEHVQLYIDRWKQSACGSSKSKLFLSKCYNQRFMITFQMDLFPKEKF